MGGWSGDRGKVVGGGKGTTAAYVTAEQQSCQVEIGK